MTIGAGRFRVGLGEAAGAAGDLGVFVPLVAALVLVNGLNAGAVLLGAGVLVIGSGVFFRVPFPVQPLKALTAVAVARHLSPQVIHAAGLEIGIFLLLLSVGGVAERLATLFTRPVVRALQFGVGVLLMIAAVGLVVHPPSIFRGAPGSPWLAVLAVLTFAGIAWASRNGRYEIALLVLVAGIGAAWIAADPVVIGRAQGLSLAEVPSIGAFGTAFFLLVIPQLPLTFGNAVVAVVDTAHDYFGREADRVTARRVCVSAGAGNLLAAAIGGMPMCHGSGGLTAHFRLGARTAGMNLLLGGSLLVLGLLFPGHVLALFGLLPVWALGAFLAFAGIKHALLVRDLRAWELVLAVGAGAVGAFFGNLAITTAVALAAVHGHTWFARLRDRPRGYHSSDVEQGPRSEARPAARPGGAA